MELNTLTLTLKPHWENGTVAWTHMDFAFTAQAFDSAALLRHANSGFNGLIPFAEYDSFYLEDDDGNLPFEITDSPYTRGPITYKDIIFSRKAHGIVRWGYRALPRVLPEGYRTSPYFDFRSEPGGMNGLGYFSFILPSQSSMRFRASVQWDLSEMPQGSRGVFYRASDRITIDTYTDEFMMIYYAAGLMNAVEDENFGVYWFGDTTFDAKALAIKLSDLFHAYAKFFHDKDALYRIFLRRDPFKDSGGGTAGTRSFLSGYSESGEVNMNKWYSTLAHEILHNWPYMDDDNCGEGTWYLEGCAEYYSTILPLRAGLTTPEYAADQINDKVAFRYLDNPYREIPNMEIADIQWKDRRAQTVPYGKGCLYLANTDAELRRLGKGSIDDIISVHNAHNLMTIEEWTAFIRDRLGEDGIQKFEDMKAGKLFAPDPDAFDGRFDCHAVDIEINGENTTSYRWTVRKSE